jgi:amidase
VVEELEPPSVEVAAQTALVMLAADLRVGWDLLPYPPRTKGVVSAMIEMAGYPDQAAAVLAYMTRQSLLRAWGEFQQEHPLIVASISAGVPFEAGKGYTAADVAEILRGRPVTVAVCALGLPAVALPVGIGDGLPRAVQVIGPRYREDLCLDAAAALEERAGIITPIDPRPSGADR